MNIVEKVNNTTGDEKKIEKTNGLTNIDEDGLRYVLLVSLFNKLNVDKTQALIGGEENTTKGMITYKLSNQKRKNKRLAGER